MNLSEVKLNQTYFIKSLKGEKEIAKHLGNLGAKKGERVTLISHDKGNTIILIGNARIAVDSKLLEMIEISEEALKNQTEVLLNHVPVGSSGIVTAIEGAGAVKRRLMDMGITRGTKLFIRKVAPLGDPVEIHLRGYELTLRREEAALIHIANVEKN
ncbi:MAG: ferrous iron transport protein A [Streptococcaceae bacterium]|jgi:ferrous iron transport protein A|nr:ferrous iron transport protein A [Streptococcaceae bacterium]MCH4176438.1 ferrous iron transport protein A [Streptococcaceae bacterium]